MTGSDGGTMKPIEYADRSKRWHRPGTERLTHYELACGSVMRSESKIAVNPRNLAPIDGVSLQLWKEPACSVFQVRAHNFGTHSRIFWDSFTNYTAASRRYFRAQKELHLSPLIGRTA